MKNQAQYDRLINFEPHAVTEDHECHVEKQFRESFWFKVFSVLGSGAFIGLVVYLVL